MVLSCGGKQILAHRVVYELIHGPIPDGLVLDHIDRNQSNNKPSNLRAVPQKINLENVGVRSHCVSGHKYIAFDRRHGTYSVRIKRKHYGSFKTVEEAVEKRDKVLACN